MLSLYVIVHATPVLYAYANCCMSGSKLVVITGKSTVSILSPQYTVVEVGTVSMTTAWN